MLPALHKTESGREPVSESLRFRIYLGVEMEKNSRQDLNKAWEICPL
jgi:hypothetical protein